VPRWVKAFLIGVVAVVLLLIAAMVITGGRHGPGRHQSSPAPTTAGAATG